MILCNGKADQRRASDNYGKQEGGNLADAKQVVEGVLVGGGAK